MPYTSPADLPRSIRHVLPMHAQEIYVAAFNNALLEYHTELAARRVAWAAVKRSYHKDPTGRWVAG